MSILTENLPDSLEIKGEKHKIKTDFKVWLKFSELIGEKEKFVKNLPEVFELVFYNLPSNMTEALKKMGEFYAHSSNKAKAGNGSSTNKRIFDFLYDADLIYSAFMQQYKVDLCECNMHWWKFKSLFEGLTEDTHFVKILQYRGTDLSKIKNKEEKRFYAKMKQIYKLPDNKSEKEKEKSFNDTIWKMF